MPKKKKRKKIKKRKEGKALKKTVQQTSYKTNVFFDESKRKDRWTISSLNDEILHELKYPNKVFKEEGDDISENERKDFDYYWSRTAYNFKNPTVEEVTRGWRKS